MKLIDIVRGWWGRRKHRPERQPDTIHRLLIERALTGAYIFQHDRFLYANPRLAEIFGCSIDDLLRLAPIDLVFPEDRDRVAELIRSRLQGQRDGVYYTCAARRLDGRRIMLEIYGLRTEYCGQPAVMGTLIDITARHDAETALRRSEEAYRTLVQNIPGAVYRCELVPPWKAHHMTDGIQAICGYSAEDFVQDRILFGDLIHPEDQALVTQAVNQGMQHRQAYEMEYRVRHRDGHYRWVAERGRAIYDSNQQPLWLDGVILDVTEHKQAEEERAELAKRLVHAQEDVQRHIAREIHDTVTQNLVALHMQLQALRKTADQRPDLAALDEAIALASQSTEQLRTLSYLLHPPVLDDLGLTGALHDFALGFEVRSGIRVECDFAHDMPALPAPVELALYRVVQESLHNIHRHARSPTAAIRLWREDQEMWLEIADTGCGISPARLQALQKPFTGLGVGIPGMRERLRQLGGHLNIHSSERGTTVQAIVPATVRPGSAPALSDPAV